MKRSIGSFGLSAGLLSLAYHATATLILSELQPIAGFSPTCTSSYNIPIRACPDAQSFIDATSTTGCERQCFEALNGASLIIQSACQSASAYGGTVISHAFKGDLSVYICGNQFAEGSNTMTATNAAAIPTSPPVINTSSSPPTASTSVSTTGSTTIPTTSASTSATAVSTTTTSAAASATSNPTSTSSTPPTTLSSRTTMATTASSASRSQTPSSTSIRPSSSPSTQSSKVPFDSSPFDQSSVADSSAQRLPSTSHTLWISGLMFVCSWSLFS